MPARDVAHRERLPIGEKTMTSDLTLALSIVGGLVLAGVIGYNAWVSARNVPRQPDAAQRGESPESVLATAASEREISAPLRSGQTRSPDAERHDPSFDLDPSASRLTAAPTPQRRAVLDGLVDVLAPITLDALVTGDAAVAAMPSSRRAGSKPMSVEGFNDAEEDWEPPQAGARYRAFQVGVQLANRTGALNEIEYSEFVVKAQAFADAVGGSAEFPEMLEEVARARELDQFAGAHDAQLTFVLRALHAAWEPRLCAAKRIAPRIHRRHDCRPHGAARRRRRVAPGSFIGLRCPGCAGRRPRRNRPFANCDCLWMCRRSTAPSAPSRACAMLQ